MLDDLIEEAKQDLTREERLEIARAFQKVTEYRNVDLETELLDEVAKDDMARINDENEREILAEYPAGFYRSELRAARNANKETK